MSANDFSEIPVIRGKKPAVHEKEFLELMQYETGNAEKGALEVKGPYKEPWLNVVHAYEPVSMPSFEKMLGEDFLRKKMHGKVMDVAAGSCWLSAKLSLLPEVKEVFAIDLSEKFLLSSGVRCMKSLDADLRKIRIVASDFNELPFETGTVDCAFLFAAIHHSLSPIKTLQEVARCVKPGGSIMILENPPATINIQKAREKALSMSENVSEIAHTRGELEYLMRAANIGELKIFTFDILSRKGWRMKIRKLLRRCGVEHHIMNPPTYLFFIERK